MFGVGRVKPKPGQLSLLVLTVHMLALIHIVPAVGG